jgi:cob(I)alamin adenosyltransferase
MAIGSGRGQAVGAGPHRPVQEVTASTGYDRAMGQRLTQITTRTGDDGSTGLGDGTRTRKDAPRVHAMGDVDELNSSLGVLLAEPLPDDVRELLGTIQHELFNLGGELSIPGYELLKADAVARLDTALAHYNGARSCG